MLLSYLYLLTEVESELLVVTWSSLSQIQKPPSQYNYLRSVII